ncbi:MAG TPA: hypothetical protein VFW87_12930 [Pirellulales bacterium]|nr:hypothetical protein [Pirellulales bacterium]
MHATADFRLSWLAIVGVVVVVGLLVATVSSRSWLGAASAFLALLLVGGVLLGSLAVYRFRMPVAGDPAVREIAEMPPPPPVMHIESARPPLPPLPDAKLKAGGGTGPLRAEADEGTAASTTTSPPATAPAGTAQAAGNAEAADTAEAADGDHGRLPAWVYSGAGLVGDVYQMPITVGPYATREECDTEQAKALDDALHRYVCLFLGEDGAETLQVPGLYVRRHIVRTQIEEHRETSVGPMIYRHTLLAFGPAEQQHIEEIYKQSLVARRLKFAGIGAAGVFGLLATVFGYLKLDTLSRGYYTGHLQAAAALAITGLAAVLLGSFAQL